MSETWSYEKAFSRNLGLVTQAEQTLLRESCVAVAGLGGVGGSNLITLARLGIGRFTIADPDTFTLHNINRQYGATVSTQNESKAEIMAAILRDINPEVTIRIFKEPLGLENADSFLDGANVLVDGIDVFEIDLRRTLFRKAKERNIFAFGAGPVGFSTAWIVFDPNGISFDRYFDISDRMSDVEKFVAYVVGVAPAMTQRSYMNVSSLNFYHRQAPSSALACQLASGVVAIETLKILLKRGKINSAPTYQQFDPFTGKYIKGRLWMANQNPLQIIKRKWIVNFLQNHQDENKSR